MAQDGAADADQQVHRQVDRRHQQRPGTSSVGGGEDDHRPCQREPEGDLDRPLGRTNAPRMKPLAMATTHPSSRRWTDGSESARSTPEASQSTAPIGFSARARRAADDDGQTDDASTPSTSPVAAIRHAAGSFRLRWSSFRVIGASTTGRHRRRRESKAAKSGLVYFGTGRTRPRSSTDRASGFDQKVGGSSPSEGTGLFPHNQSQMTQL